jgi:phytol kinase
MVLTHLLWIAVILAALLGALGGLRVGQKRFGWHPELVRKCAHVLMGLSTLSFPWLFDKAWPVILLAALAAGLLWAVRTVPALNASLGQTLGAVKRASLGELLFPLAVALVFAMSLHDSKAPPGLPVLYLAPILVLTLADALAALIGVSYGKVRYRTDDGVKSAEGSMAFFGVAFLCTHTLLLLGTPLGRAETLLIALHLALLVTIMEALSWNGLDNLFTPLGAYVLLRMFVGLHAWDLFVRLVVILILLLAMQLWRERTYLRGNALLGVALALYSIWFLGGRLWIWPALVLWIGYTRLCPAPDRRVAREHNAQAVVAVAAAPIFWLLVNGLSSIETFLPYVTSLASHLSLILFAHLWAFPRPRWRNWLYAGSLGFALICLPYLAGWMFCPVWPDADGLYTSGLGPALAQHLGPQFWGRLAACLAATFGSVLVFWLWQFRPHGAGGDGPRWFRQAVIPLVFSLLAALLGY